MSKQEHPHSEDDQNNKKTSRRRLVISAALVAAVIALVVAVTTLLSGHSLTGPAADDAPAIEASQVEQPENSQGQADGSSDTASAETCTHDWTVTYKTIHHDAETHTETVEPVYGNETTYHTVCNECQQVIDGIADQHIKETGHSGYSTNVPITDEVVVSEGYTREVTDTPAYDETVADELVCTLCGATRPLDGTTE